MAKPIENSDYIGKKKKYVFAFFRKKSAKLEQMRFKAFSSILFTGCA